MPENIEQEHERLSQPVTLEDLDQALDTKDLEIDHGVVYYRIHKNGHSQYSLFADSEETFYGRLESLLVGLTINMGVLKPHEEMFDVTYVRPHDPAATQSFYNLLVQHKAIAIDVHERDIYVTWGRKEDEKKFQQAWRERPIEPIDLYEDSLGNLFLHQKGASLVYQTDASQSFHLENPFDQEAEAISLGDTQDWSEDWVHGYAEMQDGLHHPQTLHIATWRRTGVYELHVMPGDAGKRYLKIPSVLEARKKISE